MMLHSLVVAGLCLLPVAPCAAAEEPANPVALERALPADVWAYFGCDDVKALYAGAESSEFGRFLKDPKLAPLRDGLAQMFENIRKDAAAKGSPDPLEFARLVEGPAALAVLDPSAFDTEYVFGETSFPPLLFVLGAKDTDALLAKIEESLVDEVTKGEVVRESREIAGVAISVFSDKPDDDAPAELAIGSIGAQVFLLASDLSHAKAERLEAIVRGLTGDQKDALADSPTYKAALAGPGGSSSGGVHGYVNLASIVTQALKHAHENVAEPLDDGMEDDSSDEPIDDGRGDDDDDDEDLDELDDEPVDHGLTAEGAEKLENLGLNRLGYAAAQFTPSANGSALGFEVTLDGDTAVGKLIEQVFPNGPFQLAARIPQGTRNSCLVHLDFPVALDAIGEFLDVVDPEAAAEMRDGLEEASAGGFDLKAQVLAPLGREIGIFRMPVKDENEALPGSEDDPCNIGVVVALTDGATLEATIEKLVKEQGLAAVRRRSEFDGHVIWTLPTPLGVSISYSISSDLLVASGAHEIVEDVLRRSANADLPSLASDETVKAGTAAIGGATQSIEFTIDAAANALTFVEGMNEVAALAGTLPHLSLEDVKKYITGRAVYGMTLDSRGISGRGLWQNEKQ